MSQQKTEHEVVTKDRPKLKRPQQFKVLLHNDDYTTMEFVIFVIQSVFHKSPAEATQIMLQVHEEGVGVCGVYSHEIAETKVEAVHELAQQYEYPLKASMEEA
ncbi:MAG: ATP-dependent Clp protease adapter ClpS [bacterium]|jgi:ATP-dependent Clp protease adaptor protein ClpS